jgi:hypothetical protein
MDITVPVGSYATVHIPAKINSNVKESGVPLDNAKGIQFVSIKKNEVIVKIESGKYHFEVVQ